MGIKAEFSEISRLIIYYILILNTCCDISLITCDIHAMRQKHIDGLSAMSLSTATADKADFKINATELEEHIMSGLNMTTKPDIETVSALINWSRLMALAALSLWQKNEFLKNFWCFSDALKTKMTNFTRLPMQITRIQVFFS